jgi:RHS repeat-associated protein
VPVYRFTYADGRVPMSVETSAGTLRLLTDQVGTVRALVASDGTISSRVERDTYGAVTSGTAGFPLGFAGGLQDADTGLVHFGAREYDPALGRWMSRDPIDFGGGDANLYAYVLGDPVRGADPSGTSAWSWTQYALDSATFVGTVGQAFTVGFGLNTANPATVGVGLLMGRGVMAIDAIADAHFDAHTGGCRSQGNEDRAAWYLAKTGGGTLDPVANAFLELGRGLVKGIPSSVNTLYDDEYWLEKEWDM